jgi:diguanylate cyclase (GGDEF)-like protein
MTPGGPVCRRDRPAGSGPLEFAIILDNCAEDRARRIGQQLLQALNPLEFEWKGSRYTTGASIGPAMNTMDVSDEKAWLEHADEACYGAKRQGRGQLRVATPIKSDELPTKHG